MGDFWQLGTIRDPSNQLDLRYGLAYRGSGQPKRFVVFTNGRTEWIEKYEYMIADLKLPADTAFLTWDHRGQGASGGARAYVNHYDSFAADAAAVIQHVVGDKPYVVMSHSMGGMISLYATLTGFLQPRALVLCSPMLGLPHKPVPHVIAKPLSRLLSHLALGAVSTGAGGFSENDFATNNLTHHYEHYVRMKQSPYPVPGATFGWVAASFAATDVVFDPKNLANLKTPTLVVGGTEETVVDFAAFQSWIAVAAQHAQAPVQLRLIPGARHELLSEIPEHYDPSVAAIREWFKDFLA